MYREIKNHWNHCNRLGKYTFQNQLENNGKHANCPGKFRYVVK